MRVLVLISLTSLIISSMVSSQPQGWRGIVPLRSMRADVERVLGRPDQNISEYSVFYRTSTETVMIQYAQGLPCGIGEKYSQWRVPRNAVERILVTPIQTLRVTDLGIDKSKYDIRQGGHVGVDVYYINEETGESLRVSKDEIKEMSYFPGTFAEDLRCPGLAANSDVKCHGLAPPRFDIYGHVSSERQKALLDNFGIALTEEPNGTGFIIAYAGKQARAGEAKETAKRAANYLVKVRRVNSNRLNAIDGGYRQVPEVELYVVPDGVCAPTPIPTVDPRDVQIVNVTKSRRRRG